MSDGHYDAEGGWLTTASGTLCLPAFFPDATYGYVRGVLPHEVAQAGIQGLVMNAFHLMSKPGTQVVRRAGGLHRFSGWQGPIVTDSGGFQVYSLIRQNARNGSITNKGIFYHPPDSKKKVLLTPQKSVQLQLAFGADIVICLDDCTHVADSPEVNARSVERTILWAGRCRQEFDSVLARQERFGVRPLLFAVIQGGDDRALRRQCADALLEIGFDGYCYGGYPLDAKGKLLEDMLGYTRELVPPRWPAFALGVGHPDNVRAVHRLGYQIFDCSLPTRDARGGRLYVAGAGDGDPGDGGPERTRLLSVYLTDKKHKYDEGPLSETCDCHACRNVSRAYLYHLFRQGEASYLRLATLHNLTFMARLVRSLRPGPPGRGP